MNFFEHQSQAKKHTTLLIFYFFVAVALIVGSIDVVVEFIAKMDQLNVPVAQLRLWTIGITLLVILLGTLHGMIQLAEGGAAIAKSLGGTLVRPDTKNPNERKLLNVVEEMAIASGMSVPPVYRLSGNSINAFAAGLSPQRAVIAVTEGAMNRLDRDELQGVIAHEFSHIFNGDMRISMRLMGLLHGILLIAIIGRILLKSRGGRNPLPLLGLPLLVIGYIGVFMSRIIKSAVSRQRELLADASAVQFTRNPDGLRDALVKIQQGSSYISDPSAETASHLFFASGIQTAFDSLFATHPPLSERIRAIDPTFRGPTSVQVIPTAEPDELSALAALSPHSTKIAHEPSANKAPAVTATIGAPTEQDIDLATTFRSSIPQELNEILADPSRAEFAVYALLLSDDDAIRAIQLKTIATDETARRVIEQVMQALVRSKLLLRLPLVEIAVPTIRLLPKDQQQKFLRYTRNLVYADNRVTPFEFAIEVSLAHSMNTPRKTTPSSQLDIRADAICLLSFLAYVGAPRNEGAAEKAFNLGYRELDSVGRKIILPWDQCGPEAAREALTRLADAGWPDKRKIVGAFAACILADGKIEPAEWEVLRALCQSLDCPTPIAVPLSLS